MCLNAALTRPDPNARSWLYVTTPPDLYVRALTYRVVRIIHIAASVGDKVVILRPSDTFLKI